MSEDQQINRRNFLAIATWAIGGFIGIAMAIPAVAYIIGPALKRRQAEDWIRLGGEQGDGSTLQSQPSRGDSRSCRDRGGLYGGGYEQSAAFHVGEVLKGTDQCDERRHPQPSLGDTH